MAEVPLVQVPVIAEAVRVEIAKLELKPGEMLVVKSPSLSWEAGHQLQDAIEANFLYRGVDPPPIFVIVGDIEFSTAMIPPDALDHLADLVADELKARGDRAYLEPDHG
jgi:hypothetical protein